MTITPDRPKALQTYLRADTDLKKLWVDRVGFLKVESWSWPAIVFNEGSWGNVEGSNVGFEKGIDIFPILIDVVVKYEDYKNGYDVRNTIRQKIWKFNGRLNWSSSTDREGTIAFRQFLAPSYNHETNEIIFGGVYLLKQNYDYEVIPTPTHTVLDNTEEENNANDTN